MMMMMMISTNSSPGKIETLGLHRVIQEYLFFVRKFCAAR